ncbi:L-rhamnose isomerase [Escherichia coli]|uniref:L-rhamnose isomerase n=1 Tax=Escherichia coli TaxID=562 RepID=A0A2X3KPR2_ECOLX|nr:L-rhamnose isomerase [Escherichia coli]
MTTQLEQAWELAKQRFAAVGIDVEEALRQLESFTRFNALLAGR